MAATDGQIILAASRFGDTQPIYLRDFAIKPNQLPAIAKIVKGQHLNLGVPTLSNPSLQSTALFLNAGKKYQILAQPIKIKEGRKPTNVGSKVLIPETYPGYFELLSEDGRSTRCIDSAFELSKRRNLKVLVRETFRCNYMNKTIHAGEILTTIQDNGKILQCKNHKDEIINLPLETKAKFSPIAKEDSISGVHTVKNLLLKRMPVIVRLVYGSAPKGLKQPFIPELRLLGCVEVDRVFALPLQKDTDLVPVPLNAKIKLQRAKNMEQLEHFIEYSRFFEKAQRLLIDARDRLQIVDLKLSEKDNKKDSKSGHNRGKLPLMMQSLTSNSGGVENVGYVLRKSASCDSYTSKTQHQPTASSSNSSNSQNQSLNAIADEYNEIDHIYDYVRGLTPLSKGLTRFEPINESQHHHQQQKQLLTDNNAGNYSSLKRVSHNNNNNNSSNSNINNYSSLESNKINSHNYYTPQQYHNNNISNNNTNSNNHQSATSNSHNEHRVLHNIQPHFVINHSHIQEDIKPVPPPIETIPGKKLAEKRQRPTLPKLYVKNSNSNNNNNILNNSNSNPTTTTTTTAAPININNNNNSLSLNNNININNNSNNNSSHHTKIITNNCNGYNNNSNQQQQQHNISSSNNNNINNSNNNNNNNSNNNNSSHNGGGISPVNALNSINGNKDCLEPQSPLFHIRYKSLSSLQLTPPDSNSTTPISITPKGHDVKINQLTKSASTGNHHQILIIGNNIPVGTPIGICNANIINNNNGAREGTLDSSRSGGRTSGDSNKLPEKKTRRLSRPRSLSNLVWDLRPSKDKTKKKLYIHHFDSRHQGTLYL